MYRQMLAGILVMVAPTLWAQGEEVQGRGVARVSLMNGEVTIQRGDAGDWVAAVVNAPLVTGDKVFAARQSRAELQLDHSNFVRMGEDTEVKMAEMENGRYQVQVAKGIITYRILRESTGQVEINTPAVAVRPLGRGSYRIEVQENGETLITAREGEAEIYSGQGTERLRAGRTLVARMGPQDRAVEVQEIQAAGRDEWDRWNDSRDGQMSSARSTRYVDPSVWGVEDLDQYGSWRDVDGSGDAWYPSQVSADWSPYSNGRWAWVDYYGWTWVGYEPWGWAPYHWGRWNHHPRYGWGWYPGARYQRSYWSPALVGFFGWGSGRGGLSVGFGFGNVGWVPLARGERYYPWYGRGGGGYGRGRGGYNNVNIVNVTNIHNSYRNAGVNGGMRSVNTEDFARGRVTNPRRVSLADVGNNAGQIRGLVPVVPEQESRRLSDRSVRSTPRTEGRDRFYTRQQPTAVERVPFTEQRQQVERSVRGAGGPERRREGVVESGASPAAAGAGSQSVRGVSPQQTDGNGWRRYGDDRRSGVTAPTAPAAVVSPQTGRTDKPPLQSSDAVVVRPQSTDRGADRGVDRSGGSWRRMGEDRQVQPQSVSPSPTVDRQSQPVERRQEREMQRFPTRSRDRSEQRVEPRQEQFQSAPVENRRTMEMQRFPSRDRGQQRIEQFRSAPPVDNRPSMEMQRFPSRERFERRAEPRQEQFRSAPPVENRRFEQRSEPRQEQFRSEPRNLPRAREQNWNGGGGGRQIELNRPIVQPRARQESNGGGGGRFVERNNGGGRGDNGGNRGDNGGGRSSERGGGGRGRH